MPQLRVWLWTVLALGCVAAAPLATANAVELWDEVDDGDLPDTTFSPPNTLSGEAPQDFGTLATGDHQAIGQSNSLVEYDGAKFTIDALSSLTAFTVDVSQKTFLRVLKQESVSSWSPLNNFISGDQTLNAGTFDILAHVGTSSLGPGTYAFIIRDGLGAGTLNYTFDLTVIPEPGTCLLLAAGVCLWVGRERSRRNV